MSIGGGSNTGTCDADSRKPAIDQLRALGIATVIASGNDGFTDAVSSPGCISTAVTVGSTSKFDVISGFSNSSAVVDLLAPGSSIQSSVPGTGYAFFNGTSMATPHVAGAFAALKSRMPSATVDQIEAALKVTGTPVTDIRLGGTQTKPRIRVDLALNLLLGSGGPIMSVTPAGNILMAGPAGGPLLGNFNAYTIRNVGLGPLSWSAAISQPSVFNLSQQAGTLASGENATVAALFNTNPNALPIGTYSSTLTFTNVSNANGNTTRTATVIIGSACHDTLASATALLGTISSVIGWTTLATGEVGEPDHAGVSTPLNSVWCKFTATSTGTATFTTVGSNFDTTLAAYTGASVGALTQIAANDDFSGNTSQISFTANAGTTYYIAVDGFAGALGNYTLNYTLPSGLAPANDNFAGAITISGSSGSTTGNNVSAAREVGEPVHFLGTAGNRSVWWRWTAPSTGIMRLDVAGSSFDTVLAVYTGAAVGSLTQVNSNDDNAASPQSRLTFRAVAGTTYFIAVDGKTAGASGSIAMAWSLGRPARFDFDGDGTSDILWFNSSIDGLGMFRMQNGTPSWVSIGQGAAGWTIAGVGDFDGDGTSDVLWFNASSFSLGMFRMQNGVPVWVGTGQGASGWSIAGTGDYNGDGTTDILWYHAATSSVGMFQMINGVPTWVGIGQGATGWIVAGSGDFNGDGTTDILWYHAATSAVGMFQMNNGGVPAWVGIGQGAAGWSIAGTGDFNGDGTTDILWHHGPSAVLGMFQMNNGVPAWAGIGQGASGWSIAGTGDYNGNGTTDILWYQAASSVVGQFQMANGVPTWAGIGQGASGWSIAGNSSIVGTPAFAAVSLSGP